MKWLEKTRLPPHPTNKNHLHITQFKINPRLPYVVPQATNSVAPSYGPVSFFYIGATFGGPEDGLRRAMAILSERIAQARKQVKAMLRKKWPSKMSDTSISAAEERMWHISIRKHADTSHKTLEELPDGETVDLYLTRASDETLLAESMIRAMATQLDRRDGIAQRVRARSKGRQEAASAPQTTIEADTAVKGQWSWYSDNYLYLVCLVVALVYVVERTKQ